MKIDYELRQACFVCSTPYQIIGAISITLTEKIKADIFIVGFFPDFKKLSARLENMMIFNHVYTIDCSEKTSSTKRKNTATISFLNVLKQIIRPERFVSKYLGNLAYKTFYSSSRAHIKMLFLYALQKRNPQMKINIFDDGLGSYQKESHVLNATKIRNYAEKLFGLKSFNSDSVSIQLYLYKMAQLPQYLKKYPIRQMPRLNWYDEKNKRILKTLFGITDVLKNNEKVILFDNYRDSKSRINMFKKIDVCFQKIIDIVSNENILFKGHPRSLVSPNIAFTKIAKQGIPIEVFYSDMDNLESRILVAYNSTAVYTPKILFNKEPWVISLHRIVGAAPQENPEEIYQMFLSEYNNPQKLLAPNNIKELQNMLMNALSQK